MRKTQLLLSSHDEEQQQQQQQQTRHQHQNGNFNSSGVGAHIDGGSESYSSASSFTESYSDSSDLANWEEHVAENGNLFYAEYSLHGRRTHGDKRIEFSRSSSLRMGKRMKETSMANSRKQQQQQSHQQQQQQQQQQQIGKEKLQQEDFKFSHIRHRAGASADLSQKHLELVITSADRYRFGRRSTAVESILGFRVVPFSDQAECLMVDGFVHDMPAMQQQRQQSQMPPIKRGDWFKSLDDIEVRTSNVDELLLQFVEPTKVCLKFQGPPLEEEHHRDNGLGMGVGGGKAEGGGGGSGGNSTIGGGLGNSGNDLRKIENFSIFADLFEKLQLPSTGSGEASSSSMNNSPPSSLPAPPMPFLLLILPPEYYQNDQHRDSMFYFPDVAAMNFLYKSRGSFLTLNAVLSSEMQTKPICSSLLVDDHQYFVCYRSLSTFLVLFAYSATYQTLMEANLRSDELIAYMRFTLPTISLEHLSISSASSVFLRQFLLQFCSIQRTRILAKSHHSNEKYQRRTVSFSSPSKQCLFEELLRESRSLPLPKEAQLRIFDALSEMEAMDYRNWNDEPLNTHREFFIHGSVLYYDHFLLTAQMPMEMQSRVESFLRCRGIFDFITNHCVKELYVWEEIVPPDSEGIPEMGRFFLTICSRSHLILAVVLKIFDAPDLAPDAIIPPSLFYIEEIQETLDHLISCGIESLAMFWSISNKRPEIIDANQLLVEEIPSTEKEGNKLETFIKQKLTPSSSSGLSGTTAGNAQSQRTIAYDEETHMCSSLGGSSIQSLTHSEDDSSRKRLTTNSNDNVSDSGSDWDNFGEQNPLYYGYDAEMQTQMTESLWKEINNVVPVKISAGWKNSIFHYVYVDSANGTVFCPLRPPQTTATTTTTTTSNNNNPNNSNSNSGEVNNFLSEIRRACLVIQNVLQRTKNFRRQLSLETSSSGAGGAGAGGGGAGAGPAAVSVPSNPKLMGLAIKEHGMTIQIRETSKAGGASNVDGENSNNASSSPVSLYKGSFVVVGRLFHTPMREIYVCHRPDVPQNMVELAFRLSFFSVG